MKRSVLFLLASAVVVVSGAPDARASGQEYESKEAQANRDKKHKAEHRNGYHVEPTTHHTHRTVGVRGQYTHQHSYHDLEVPMLEPIDLVAKPNMNGDGLVALNNKYCPVTGDMAKSEFAVQVNGIIYNVACKWSADSIKNDPDKYMLDLNHFEVTEP